jgi:hypothetical protein
MQFRLSLNLDDKMQPQASGVAAAAANKTQAKACGYRRKGG